MKIRIITLYIVFISIGLYPQSMKCGDVDAELCHQEAGIPQTLEELIEDQVTSRNHESITTWGLREPFTCLGVGFTLGYVGTQFRKEPVPVCATLTAGVCVGTRMATRCESLFHYFAFRYIPYVLGAGAGVWKAVIDEVIAQ